MRTAGVVDLKSRLSSYLKQVKAGREILITERGLPIAKLVPLGAEPEARRRRLGEGGVIQLGRGRIRKMLCSPPEGSMVGEGVLAELLAEREEGR